MIPEGRIKQKLRKLLSDAGFSVIDFWEQHGDYRMHKYEWDLACWGCQAHHDGIKLSMASWDTMTECVRYGLTVDYSKIEGWKVYSRK